MCVTRCSFELRSRLISLFLCYTFIAPYFAISSFHEMMAAPIDEHSATNARGGGFLSLQSDSGSPVPGVPGPNLPNLDQARQSQPPRPEPPPSVSSNIPCLDCCPDCPPPTPTPTPRVNHPPVASFIINNPNPFTNQSISLADNGSYDPDSGDSIISFSWDFGDNTAHGTGVASQHAYSSAGTYVVRLTATDTHGATGRSTAIVTVSWPPTTPVNAAAFISQVVPTTMIAGQSYDVQVRMKNTGSATWSSEISQPYKLTSRNPEGNSTWGVSSLTLSNGGTVGPNQEHTFSFRVTAPATAGTYHFQWQMVQNSASNNWFGEQTPDISVFVYPAAGVRQKAPFDFDGDGKTDVAVWNPETGNWHIVNSHDNSTKIQYDWGRASLGDRLVPGDYDGDGKADLAVWRPAEGNYYIIQSSDNAVKVKGWGQSNDFPVPGDYDGDGTTDIAVFRPSDGNWYIIQSSTPNNVRLQNWGAGNDVPVPGDYDGDGKTDLAIWRPGEGNWYILNSSTNTARLQGWGASGDLLVPGDYDGDGRTDVAVWRPADGNFYILNSSTGTSVVRGWGSSNDVPVPGDYDGDGRIDIAVWRPSEGTWYILNSSTNTGTTKYLGGFGVVTVPSAYVRRTGNGAMFVAQSVPSTVSAGQQYNVTVRMRNVGTTVWTAATLHRLGSQSTPGSAGWGRIRAIVPTNVVPGAEVSFTFTITAPTTTGTYNFQWRMIQDSDNEWFGDFTPNVPVSVIGGTVGNGEYTPTSVQMALLSPRNRTGGAGVDLLSGNYNWRLPLLSLPGRAGLDLGLSLSYNSLVWTKVNNTITWDADHGFPGPGFHLGFPVIEPQFFNDQAQRNAYLMVLPSGARLELRETNTQGIYESIDSSHMQLTSGAGDSLLLRTTDGAQFTYLLRNGAYRCTNIIDRNGNSITVAYNSNNGRLEQITDTLGRVVNFEYDANQRLIEIKQKLASGAARTWVTFGYSNPNLIIRTAFNGLTLNGVQNGQQVAVLNQVGLADGSLYKFEHTSWGQIAKIRHFAFDGRERAYISYNLPADESAPQTDCPRFTERTDWAENFNYSGYIQQSLPVTTAFQFDGNGAWGKMIAPDRKTVHKEYFATHGWEKGLTIGTKSFASVVEEQGDVPKKWTTVEWIQDNPALSYSLNPRPVETNIYDADGNRRRSTIEYTDYGLPSDTFEYDATGQTILRRTHIEYNLAAGYLSKRLIGLMSAQYVFGRDSNGGAEKLVSKLTYQYDERGEFLVSQGAPVQHDNQTYGIGAGSVIERGLLTSVIRWDVLEPDNSGLSVKLDVGYNTTGSIVFRRDARGHKVSISYTDSFSDNVIRNTLAYPTILTDADGFQSTIKYDYDLGAVSNTTNPKGAEQSIQYDEAGRVRQTTNLTNGAYTRYVYGPYYVQSFSLLQEGTPNREAYAISIFDGAGRLRATASSHPSSDGKYRAQYTDYDVMGRVSRQSNPAEIDVNWTAYGDDGRGWLWTAQAYDWKGRPTITTNTDDTTKRIDYGGCGCAGGDVMTMTDEGTLVNGELKQRRQRVTHDVLGRLIKSEVLNWDGTIYSTTTNSYNARDQLIQSNEQGQLTTMTYDGHGRLQTSQRPEQSAPTSYSYYGDDTMRSMTDARGVLTNYSYNNRQLVKDITYSIPAHANIAHTSSLSFTYDEAGHRTKMTDGSGSVSYSYDTLSRLEWEERTFTNVGSFKLSYGYNLAGEVSSITDPWGATVGYKYDEAGNLSAVNGYGYGNISTYASDLQYRAWGALKHLTYGNNLTLDLQYNARLLVSRFAVRGGRPQPVFPSAPGMEAEQYYYPDGSPRYTRNSLHEQFDHAYSYDQVGRLKEAYSGNEARSFANQPPGPAGDFAPYRLSYQYDVWDNLTQRTGRFWSQGEDYTATYLNGLQQGSNLQQGFNWQYDNNGNLRRDAVMAYVYDAVGNNTNLNKADETVNISQAFDGDAEVARRTVTNSEQTPQATTTTLYLRSSVLGGRVVSEIKADGQKQVGYVYANGTLIAVQSGAGQLYWHHENPLTGSRGHSFQNGAYQPMVETDSGGVHLGFADPYVSTEEPILQPEMVSLVGGSGGGGGQCRLDGIEFECARVGGLLAMGAAVIGPSTTTRWNAAANNGQGGFEFFRAYADGYEGWGPLGAVSNGHGGFGGTKRPVMKFRGVGTRPRRVSDATRPRRVSDLTRPRFVFGSDEGQLLNHSQQDNLRRLPKEEVSSLVDDILKIFEDNPECEKWTNTLLEELSRSTGFNAGNIRGILGAFKQSGIIFDSGKNGDGGGVTGAALGYPAINLTFSQSENPTLATVNTAVALLHEILHWSGFQLRGGNYVSNYTDVAMATAWNKLGVVISVNEFKDRYNAWIESEIKAGRSPYIQSRLAGAGNRITCLGARPSVRTLK